MNREQLEVLRTVRDYLAHPDVQAMPFALPASNPLRALDSLIRNASQEPDLTQLPYAGSDHETADRIRRALGYPDDSGAFTSSGAFTGLRLGPTSERNHLPSVAIIKTSQMGWLVVRTLEDVNYDLWFEVEHNGPKCEAIPPRTEAATL